MLVGEKKAVYYAIKNETTTGRNTWLARRLQPDSKEANNHFRISISGQKQRRIFSLKCFLPGNVVADLNINLLAASLSYKVDFLLIELTDINIVSTAKKLKTINKYILPTIGEAPLSEINNHFMEKSILEFFFASC